MGTLTVIASGFSNLGASAPSNWPSNVTFPAGGSPNGTKAYTVSDADWLSLLTWVAASQTALVEQVSGDSTPPISATAAQLLMAWLLIWINGTKSAVQQFNTVPAVVPSPISIQ